MAREKLNRINKVLIYWESILDEVEELTDEYENSGWETLVLHPGDVTPTASNIADGKTGFRLVVPESELDALAEIIDEDNSAFTEFEVFRSPADELMVFVVILKSPERERAVFFPVYYDPKMDREFVESVRNRDVIYTAVSDLGQSRRVLLSHDNPTLFLP